MARCNTEEASDVVFSLAVENITTAVDASTDFTSSVKVDNLKAATVYDYTVSCASGDSVVESEPGNFKTLPMPDKEAPISFVWGADLAGQGWGRNPELTITTVSGKEVKGGYVVFDVMSETNPDFAVFQGDMIYADNAIPATKPIPEDVGGGNWTNNPTKDFVAVTLDEFRSNWKYNFGDSHMQSFLSKTPVYVQWDDHEVSGFTSCRLRLDL